ncbi:hypothetical protein JCM10212_004548 [Sporobolomyces blumeae]
MAYQDRGYVNQVGYDDYPMRHAVHSTSSYGGPYPSTHDPFSSQVSLHGPDAGYEAGEGYSAVARDKSNPYSQGYKGGNAAAGNKRPCVIDRGLTERSASSAIVVGIVAWRVVASKNDSGSSSGSGKSSGNLQYIDGTAKVVKSNPSDPSDFEKDSRLKPSFYGMAYTPFNALEPSCGATLANVTEDIQLLSQMTTRLRTYGSACNQSELVLDAIARTKTNVTVFLGAYVGDNSTVNAQQQQWILDALDKFGVDHVGGITIGNEYVLNANAASTSDATTRIQYLGEQISAFKTTLAAKNYGKTIPVGSADAGSVFTSTYAQELEILFANVHPWFGGVPIDQAAGWTWDYFQNNDVSVAESVSNGPTPYIAETGWPTASMTPEKATYEGAVSGVPELQTFLDTYVCQANKNETYYFYFEPFDEPWKEQYGGVEPYWGLFDHNRILKNITIPDCEVDSTKASG